MSDVRTWRDRVAGAAAADVGRAEDMETYEQALRAVDSWLFCVKLALVLFFLLGALSGWGVTLVQLRPADGQVHAECALMVIVATPWGLLVLRLIWTLVRGCLDSSWLLDWIVPFLLQAREWLLRLRNRLAPMSLSRSAAPQDPIRPTAQEIGKILVGMVSDTGSLCPLSAAGRGVIWIAYAVAAVAAIWIVTSYDALGFGFGWTLESSWLRPSFRHEVVEFVRTAVELPALVLGWIGSDGLPQVAAAPAAPDDDPEALALRRSWLLVLTTCVGAYLLLPMTLWTLFNSLFAFRKMNHWRPVNVSVQPRVVTATRRRRAPAAVPLRSPPVGGDKFTHVVRLELPKAAADLPAPLDQFVDLGDADATADLERIGERLRDDEARTVVVSWLPVSPDRGVRYKLRTLADASTAAPLLVLHSGHASQCSEPDDTLATRREEWREAASQTGVTPFECDLAELTDKCRCDLALAVGYEEGREGGRQPAPEPDPEWTRR